MGLGRTARFILEHPLARQRPIEAFARFAAWQAYSRLTKEAIVPFVDDVKMVVRRGMVGATGNLYCGLHEYEDMAFALHLLRPGDLFVDVGANIGSYTLLAGAAGAEIIAFEPGERFADLTRNVSLNGLNALCLEQAVGADSGRLRFTVGRDATNRIAVDTEAYREVAVVRLDDVIPRAPALIKVDVEGFEGAVLQGGERTFAQADALIIELCGQGAQFGFDEDDIRRRLADMGFRPVTYDPAKRSLGEGPQQGGNSLFVRADVAERLRSAPRHKIQGRWL